MCICVDSLFLKQFYSKKMRSNLDALTLSSFQTLIQMKNKTVRQFTIRRIQTFFSYQKPKVVYPHANCTTQCFKVPKDCCLLLILFK